MMTKQSLQVQKLTVMALMIALDFILSPILRVEGMAPMSSVVNVIAAVLMNPFAATLMALICGVMRMLFLGIPPLALTGAVFGAFLAAFFYKVWPHSGAAALGEIIGTGIIGSLLSYPVMAWFTGSANGLYLFVYTPRFLGAAIMGSIAACLLLIKLGKLSAFQKVQKLFR